MPRRFARRPASRARDGFVLVSVLWILAILTVISLGFSRRAMLERQMAWYTLDREQAQQMARGAVERALFELSNKYVLDQYNNQAGYTGINQSWARPVDLYATPGYFETAGGEGFEEDMCVYWIEDCERRVSINHASRPLLEAVKGLRFRVIDKILDRREQSVSGYLPEVFRTVDELRDMQRIPDAVWYGTERRAGMRELLTVWGDPNEGRINVNTASAQVLRALPKVDSAVVDAILKYRAGNDGELYTADDRAFESMDVIVRQLGLSAEKIGPLRRFCKTDSRFFTIRTHATRRRGKISAYCAVTVELRGNTPAILEWKEDTVGT